MAIVVTKQAILAEDIELGFGSSSQDRGGTQFNAANLPFTLTESVAEALEARYTGVYITANFANVLGNEANLFKVADGVSGKEAVNRGQVDTSLALKSDLAYVDSRLATKAELGGDATKLFRAANGVVDSEVVTVQQLALKADITALSTKADKANVLELDNTVSYSPLFEYNPATKQYVDDSIFTAFQTGTSGTFTSADNKTITVTNGLVTGIL